MNNKDQKQPQIIRETVEKGHTHRKQPPPDAQSSKTTNQNSNDSSKSKQ